MQRMLPPGKAFAREAKPVKGIFIKQGLPSHFIESLNAAVPDLQRAELDHTSSRGARSSSMAEFNDTLTLRDLRRFDALVINTLGDNPGIMAVWNIARRVGRPPSLAKATPSAPKPTPPAEEVQV